MGLILDESESLDLVKSADRFDSFGQTKIYNERTL